VIWLPAAYFTILAIAFMLFCADARRNILRGNGQEAYYWIAAADNLMACLWRVLQGRWINAACYAAFAIACLMLALRDWRRKGRRRIGEAIGAKARALRDKLVRRARRAPRPPRAAPASRTASCPRRCPVSPPPVLLPGTKFSIWRPAGLIIVPGQGSYLQRFSPGAFDHLVGSVAPARRGGQDAGTAVILSAQVRADGSGVMLAFEMLTTQEEQQAARAAAARVSARDRQRKHRARAGGQ